MAGPAQMLKEDYFVLSGHWLIKFNVSFYNTLLTTISVAKNESDSQERGVLHLQNARLKKCHFKDANNLYMYGFILMAKGTKIEFYLR